MTTIAFDTETVGLDWFDPDQGAFLATWADEKNEYAADLSDDAQVSTFLAALEQADTLVCHNLSFDVHQVREKLGWNALDNAPCADTDIISRVMYPLGQKVEGADHGTHKLKDLATVFLKADAKASEDAIERMAESMGIKLKGENATPGAYYQVWRAYPEEMERYAKEDARFTYDLYDRFMHEMDEQSARIYDLEQRVAPILIRAEAIGTTIDQEPVLALKAEYEEMLDRTTAYLEENLGADALGGEGSEDAMVDALLSAGIPLHRKTPTGKIATNHYALQEFEDDFPLIQNLFDWRRAGKFLKTYINPMVDREVVHPSFMQCGAWTGRMSCRRPNMQNIPKKAGSEVRAMFVPRKDHVFVVCDYESIEVRLLAWYLGDAGFRALINDGHDPHAWMAANIHGGSMDQYFKGTPGQPVRDEAKNTLFAISYGAGAPRIADMNKISKEQAKALISKIKSSLPNYYALNKRIRSKIESVGYVNTLWGRKQLVNREKSYVGLNALIQGSAADIMKQGLINVDAVVAPLGGYPLLVVHDEVVVEVPTENAEEALRVTEQALIEAYDLTPRLAVSGSIVSTNYADA